MDAETMRRHAVESWDACLATVGPDGRPHAVPIGFVIEGETIYFAVDAKPKHTVNLKRLRNIAANPSVAVLFDHYEQDWSKLWWVRVDGSARVAGDPAEAEHAVDMLMRKYPQYANARPSGPVVAISIQRMTGWAAADNGGG